MIAAHNPHGKQEIKHQGPGEMSVFIMAEPEEQVRSEPSFCGDCQPNLQGK